MRSPAGSSAAALRVCAVVLLMVMWPDVVNDADEFWMCDFTWHFTELSFKFCCTIQQKLTLLRCRDLITLSSIIAIMQSPANLTFLLCCTVQYSLYRYNVHLYTTVFCMTGLSKPWPAGHIWLFRGKYLALQKQIKCIEPVLFGSIYSYWYGLIQLN